MTQSAHPTSTGARVNVIGKSANLDLAFVDRSPTLVSIDEASNCILAYDLKGTKSSARLQQVLFKLEAAYHFYGHCIQNFYSDSEYNFLSTEVYLNSRGIRLHHSLPGRHCALVERAIRTIKDRAQAALFSLGYILPPICRMPLFHSRRSVLLRPRTYRRYRYTISKTTLQLPEVSPLDNHEHDTDDQPTQPLDSSMPDSEPIVDRGTHQSRAGRRTNWKTSVFNVTAQKAKDMYGTEKVTDSMLPEITQ